VIVTSDKCYENREWVYAYRESDSVGGFDPYSSSKGCAELVVGAWRRSFFASSGEVGDQISISSARAGNVIGGGDWAEDRIIPDCIRALQKKEPILVRNPHAVRPWQHVLEPLHGYLLLARLQWKQPVELGDAFNFGPTVSGNLCVREIVERVIHGWGSGEWKGPNETVASKGRLHEATFLKLDVTKAATMLGWRPIWSADEAVSRTVEWYRRRISGNFDAAAFCLEQLAAYEEAASAIT
jgi:CDP-glucose 4,6-dehydratase